MEQTRDQVKAGTWQRATLQAGFALAAAVVLAGCGGGGGDGGTPPGPLTYAVTVSVSGNGSVASATGGIDCGTACSAEVGADTVLTLTATPAAGHVLQAWGGACAGAAGAARCDVAVTQATAVSASFVPQVAGNFTLAVAVTGNGSVRSQPAGIDCGSACNASFAGSTSVVLTATPAQGHILQAWGGACAGSATTCTVSMTAARNVTATFVATQAPAPAWGAAAVLENSNDFNVADTNTFADANTLSAIDAAGNALVVWEQSDGTPNGSTRKVWSRRFVPGQGWSAAVVVPGLTTSSSSVDLVTGRLLLDASGNATWIRHNFETRRYSAAGGWSATAFAPAGSGSGELADAKVDPNGTVHLLGIGSSDVLYSRLPAGSSQWTAWADVSFTDLATRDAQLALGAQGNPIAVWRERNPGDSNYSVKANRLAGGAWLQPVRIEEVLTAVHDSVPRIATDAAGNAIAAWHQGDSVYVNRFDASTAAWGTASQVDANQVSSTFSARLAIATAADGRAVVVWSSGTFGVKSMRYAPATGFGAPVSVTSYSSGHWLGIDADGRAAIVYRGVSQWPNPTDATQNLYTRELPWGGAWSAPTLLETGAGDVKAGARCVFNVAGQAACAWAQDDIASSSVRNSLWAAVRR
jgi:hypothetical protein